MCMGSYKKNSSRVFLRDDEGKIIEIDLDNKEVSNIYCLPQDDDTIVGGYVLVENNIYCVIANKVYCINLNSADIVKYEISAAKAGFYTIVYDGNNFWLSGFYKEIYVWNPEQGVVKIISEFPEQFGIYRFDNDGNFLTDYNLVLSINPDDYENVMAIGRFVEDYAFFSDSIALGKHVWFMPHRSNGIIYIDKETYEVFFMEIDEEKETEQSIKRNLLYSKYLINYVREDRYIGVYSVKNQWIFEIDTVELCVRKRDYELDSQSILIMAKNSGEYDDRKTFREGRKWDNIVFTTMIKTAGEKAKKTSQNIGNQIYGILNEE